MSLRRGEFIKDALSHISEFPTVFSLVAEQILRRFCTRIACWTDIWITGRLGQNSMASHKSLMNHVQDSNAQF